MKIKNAVLTSVISATMGGGLVLFAQAPCGQRRPQTREFAFGAAVYRPGVSEAGSCPERK